MALDGSVTGRPPWQVSQMHSTRTLKSPSDRTLNRLIVGAILIIVIGIPVIAAIYFFDRHVDAGPSLVERQFSAAEEAVRKEPNKVSARLTLAATYMTAKRYPDAIVQFTEILKVEPTHRAALLGRGYAELASGDLVAARADYEKMVDTAKGGEMAVQDPQLEAAYYGLGEIALKQDRPKDAQTLLESAIRINRTDADALNLLGTAYLRNGDAKTAVQALKAAVALVPADWCEPYGQLGQAYTALGTTEGTAYATGMVSLCEGRLDEAKTQLQPLAAGTFAGEALLGLAMVAEGQGDTAGAMDLYKQVLATDPENMTAIAGYNRLAGGTESPAPSAPAPSPSAQGSH